MTNSERAKIWRRANPGRMRILRLRSRYGIDGEVYDLMFEEQRGQCAICGREDPRGNGSHFRVDHDHKTGKIRGLLCDTCNRGIGLLQDDPTLLRQAANYIGD